MTIEKNAVLLVVFIILGFISCSKESSLTITDDIPAVEPNYIQPDTSYQVNGHKVDVSKSVLRLNKLLSDPDTSSIACTFSLVIQTDDHTSLIVILPYDQPSEDGLQEGTYQASILFGYTEAYIEELKAWTQNGSDPMTYPTFDFELHTDLYDASSVELKIDYITEGDNVPITEDYYTPFSIPVVDPITSEPKTIRYVKDACTITKSGFVTAPSGELINISGFIEAEYHRQI